MDLIEQKNTLKKTLNKTIGLELIGEEAQRVKKERRELLERLKDVKNNISYLEYSYLKSNSDPNLEKSNEITELQNERKKIFDRVQEIKNSMDTSCEVSFEYLPDDQFEILNKYGYPKEMEIQEEVKISAALSDFSFSNNEESRNFVGGNKLGNGPHTDGKFVLGGSGVSSNAIG